MIPEHKIHIIKLCHKSLLYHNENLWIKKAVSANFDNPMGSFHWVKLCKLIGCLLLYNLNYIIKPFNHGLY